MARRRSVGGRRRSKSLLDLKLTDVIDIISSSSSETEKLGMLTRHALRMALNIAEKKCIEETDANPFQMECSACLEDIDSAVQPLYDDIILETTNTSLIETLPGYSEEIHKVEKESEQWESLKALYEEDFEKERDKTVIYSTDCSDFEDIEKYNYSKVSSEIASIVEEKKHQMEMLKNMERDYRSYPKMINALKRQKILSCAELNNKIVDSPRTLIQRCITKDVEKN